MASSLSLSSSHFRKLGSTLAAHKAKLDRASRKTEHVIDTVIKTGVTVGTSAVLGGLHGRFGKLEAFGVPAELGVGAVAFVGSLAGIGGKHAERLGDFANGLLSPYAYIQMRGVGANLATKSAGGKPAPAVTGPLPGASLSDRERAQINAPVELQR